MLNSIKYLREKRRKILSVHHTFQKKRKGGLFTSSLLEGIVTLMSKSEKDIPGNGNCRPISHRNNDI